MDTHLQGLWAKRMPCGNGKAAYHPLLFHMLDAAAVCEAFLLRTGSAPLPKLALSLGMSPDELVTWLPWFTGLHDIGKCTAFFQQLAPEACNQLLAPGCTDRPSPKNSFRHNELSDPVLEKLGLLTPVLRQVLASHHGVIVDAKQLDGATGAVCYGQPACWTDLARLLEIEYTGTLSLPASLRMFQPQDLDNDSVMLLGGLVCLCDWIASNTLFFPYASADMFTTAYWELAREQAALALNAIRLGAWRPAHTPSSFESLFDGKTPRGAQARVRELMELGNAPRLVVLELPMGAGKTEAALLMQDHWAASHRQRGAYFALPTMASSNQMYGRIFKVLHTRGDNANLHLLHARAPFVDDYAATIMPETQNPANGDESGVAAAQWFTRPKRGLLGDFAVGTVDQAFLAVLQTKHFFLRLFGLSGKTVIFDEVHAYDAYMNGLFTTLLRWLCALDSTVAVLSATLPRARLQALVQSWTASDCIPAAYPRITWVDADGAVHSEHVESPEETPITLEWWEDDDAWQDARMTELLGQGGHVAWICNTVRSAQETFCRLRRRFGDSVSLFHARFPYAQRAGIERDVFAFFGKDRLSCGTRILVATQVVEQSLDLDFDLMVSEVAPADLLLQRAGRLHRHERPRPEPLRARRLAVVMPPDDACGVPRFGGSGYVYEKDILLRTYAFLRDCTHIAIPGDVETLIENVYSAAPLPEKYKGCLSQAVQEAADERARGERHQEGIAAYSTIFEPDMPAGEGWSLKDLEEDESGDTAKALCARTRLGEPSVEVLFAQVNEMGDLVVLDGLAEHVVNKASPPSGIQLKAVLEATVRLAWYGCVNDLPKSALPEVWQKSAALRHMHCVLVDQNRCAETSARTIHLDPVLGVMVEPKRRAEETHEPPIIQSDY